MIKTTPDHQSKAWYSNINPILGKEDNTDSPSELIFSKL